MMTRRGLTRWRWSLVLSASTSLVACGSPSEGPTTHERAPLVTPEHLDVRRLVQQAKLSFHDDPTLGWVARQPTHVLSAADGVVRFTPRTWTTDEVGDNQLRVGETVEIETAAIERGDQALPLGLATTDIADDGMVRIDRGVAEERVQHTSEGAHQMWYFARPPAGHGDLVIRVSVRGQRYVGAAEDGHHFFDETSQVGLRYSHATWVDFHGKSTPVEVRFDAEASELYATVPADVVEASAFPALLDPTVSAERGTSAPGIGPNTALEENPNVAFDGTNYLVVWSDIRDLVSFDIWGTLISANMGVQNNTGIPIAIATGAQRAPAVAFNGTNYLVVWEDQRRGTTFTDIMGRIIAPNGTPVGGELTLSTSGVAGRPDVATLNGDWYVVWEDLRTANTTNVLFSRVTGAGAVIAAEALNDNPSFEIRPSIGCGATNCLVAFESQRFAHEDIARQRIDVNGLVDTVSATISGFDMGRSLAPDVAFDGTNYLVVWQDQRNFNNDIFGNRVSAATGAPITAGGFGISTLTSEQTGATVSFDGTSYLVAWQDQRSQNTNGFDIFGTRVLTTGAVVTPAGLPLVDRNDDQTLPKLTRGTGQWVMVWSDTREGPPLNVRAMRVTPTGGSDRSGVNVGLAANRQQAASLTFSNAGSNNLYLLTYSDSRTAGAGNYDIVGMRINTAGSSFDPSGRLISGAALSQVGVEQAFNGTDFLVVWQDHRTGNANTSVYGARVNISNANLIVREPNGIAINTSAGNQLAPTVAWNAAANQWLVSYGDQRNGTNTDIYASRVAADGTVVDAAGFAISNAAGVQERPDVSSDGTNWLVAWTDRRNGTDLADIYASAVSTAGAPGAAFVVSGAANRQESVRLAYNGTQYLAVWQDNRTGTTNYNVVGARINTNGTVADAGGVNLASNITLNELRPRVAVTGANWFVTWSQSEAAGSPATDLFGRQFTTALAPVAAAFAISQATGSEAQSAIGVAGANSAAVAYQRYDDTTTVRSERVRYRTVTFP